ncbi:hypothetical protein HMPREF9141_2046 [Prevotella multiformis DSM 16608]|uniref:Uncharacterized protein n=1 Tax=Prevotella multiformis DSM 16608 TaxID=888743 RepID=F0F8X9_9BACT|nr:hypothetical protein HMPREF9141_2046 [Prevotella multiformis DSM 16608]
MKTKPKKSLRLRLQEGGEGTGGGFPACPGNRYIWYKTGDFGVVQAHTKNFNICLKSISC